FVVFCFFFFQAEDGIRDKLVTGVQTCALPIYRLIRQFALDLQAYLGSAASDIQFKTCGECDQKANFDGSAAEFFQFYATTDRALHSVLPDAALSPGEFTGIGECTPKSPNCVYDTRDFLEFAAQEHLTIADVPRSLHSLLDKPASARPSA